jgi:hypothetical protein
MPRSDRTTPDTLTPAVKAINSLLQEEFAKLDPWASRDGSMAHTEIEHANVAQKPATFYRHFIPLRQRIVVLLGETYRKYFRLALAHPSRTGNDPNTWAQRQLQSDIRSVLEWIRQWYILACEGENDGVRHVGTVEFVPASTVSVSIPTTVPPLPPPTSWRAPAWLFGISPMVGVGPLKEKHVPANDSEERLGEAHTRLLLKGAKRAFFWELGAAIETVRNEEIAAAGAIPAATVGGQTEEPSKQKGSKSLLKGIEGLGPKKTDLSQYMHNLTERQHLAFSLKYEFGLGLSEIASRMGLDRKTAYEHLAAANRKINQARSNEKSKARRPKSGDE